MYLVFELEHIPQVHPVELQGTDRVGASFLHQTTGMIIYQLCMIIFSSTEVICFEVLWH